MDENVFWIKVWSIFGVVAGLLIIAMTFNVYHDDNHRQEKQLALIEGGHIEMVCTPTIAR